MVQIYICMYMTCANCGQRGWRGLRLGVEGPAVKHFKQPSSCSKRLIQEEAAVPGADQQEEPKHAGDFGFLRTYHAYNSAMVFLIFYRYK